MCFSGEGESDNPILFCDGCNCIVHQYCYGVPVIPEGDWFCDHCAVQRDTTLTTYRGLNITEQLRNNMNKCALCPNKTVFAFKMTDQQTWVHATCAVWIPETGFDDVENCNYVVGIKAIEKARLKLVSQTTVIQTETKSIDKIRAAYQTQRHINSWLYTRSDNKHDDCVQTQ